MRYELSILSNNSTRAAGDSIIVELSSALSRVQSVVSFSLQQEPPRTPDDYHDLEVRWSYDKMSWSAWAPYNVAGVMQPDPFPALAAAGRPFYVGMRATRAASSTGIECVLEKVRLDFTEAPAPEVPVESPFVESGCRAQACVTTNACSGIVADCDPSLVWRPYDMMAPAITVYENLACVATEMWGHCVRYLRVDADRTSGDPVLKEYSVYDAVDVKDILVMVKDNVFPDNAFHYMPFDMEFQEGLEVTILRKHFETVFGQGKRPQEKDFLYFPLIDRMFDVNSAYLKRDFMQAPTAYSLMLYKHQDRANVMTDRADPRIEEYVDDLTVDIEELLRGQIDAQESLATKPLQYKTISVGGNDHVRSAIHADLIIDELERENYFTLVSKYCYDMSTVPAGQVAVQWKHTVSAGPTGGVAFSFWINGKRPTPSAPSTDPVFIGQTAGSTGVSVNLQWGVTGASAPLLQSVDVEVGTETYSFEGVPDITGKWVGVVLNVMPGFGQIQLTMWETRPASEKTTNLLRLYTSALPYDQSALAGGTPMYTTGAQHLLTNLRVWSAPIEEEKQPLVLNQYVVRDAHLAKLIDNAVPPLRIPRTYAR